MEPAIRNWLLDLILLTASGHELSGPEMSHIDRTLYKNRAIAEFRAEAILSNLDGDANIPVSELDRLCELAAEDLFHIRTLRRASRDGQIAVADLQKTPWHPIYQKYFDESPGLMHLGLASALARREQLLQQGPATLKAPAKAILGQPSLSQAEFEHFVAGIGDWYEAQVMGLAMWGELAGTTSLDLSEKAFVDKAEGQLYENVLLAVQAGDFVISCEDAEKPCRRIAGDVYEMRRLYRLWSSGKIAK